MVQKTKTKTSEFFILPDNQNWIIIIELFSFLNNHRIIFIQATGIFNYSWLLE